MKRTISFVILFLSLVNNAISQGINNITYTPANPTAGDTITVYVDVSFTYGGCDLVMSNIQDAGSIIYLNGYHCLGALTVICDKIDTFKIAPHPAGTYSIIANEFYDFGGFGDPCFEDSFPSYQDSISIVITGATGISESSDCIQKVIYNDSRHSIYLAQQGNCKSEWESIPHELIIFDSGGRIVFEEENLRLHEPIAALLPGGIYFYRLSQISNQPYYGRLIVIH